MPETAPLDVSEPAVGYELDSITLRNIASVRYVRHHEWLDHVLGNPLANSAIIPPNLMEAVDTSKLEERTKELDAEIAALEEEKKSGWQFHVDNSKAEALTKAIHTLRQDFGNDTYEATKKSIEDFLDVKIEQSNMMRPVPISYDRKAVDLEQARKSEQPTDAKENAGQDTAMEIDA